MHSSFPDCCYGDCSLHTSANAGTTVTLLVCSLALFRALGRVYWIWNTFMELWKVTATFIMSAPLLLVDRFLCSCRLASFTKIGRHFTWNPMYVWQRRLLVTMITLITNVITDFLVTWFPSIPRLPCYSVTNVPWLLRLSERARSISFCGNFLPCSVQIPSEKLSLWDIYWVRSALKRV